MIIKPDPTNANKVCSEHIPKFKNANYDLEFVEMRRTWLSKKTQTNLYHVGNFSVKTNEMKGNIENLIGVAQIPIGIAGPLKVNGEYAKGDFFIPLATTEGSLVLTYHMGMRIVSRSGGVSTKIIRDEIHISPIFRIGDLNQYNYFINWISDNFQEIKSVAESTTKYGKLLRIDPIRMGTTVLLKFVFFTGDAQGLNMINRATESASKYILQKTNKQFIQRSNYSGIKKVTMASIYQGCGKAVIAESIIPRNILRLLRVTPEKIVEFYNLCLLSSNYAGTVGITAQAANAVTAMFIACGQDVADVSVSHIGNISYELMGNDLHVNLYIPNLLVGTVGGGTNLGTQKECLEIIGCHGSGKARKFAEIVTATVLSGEISTVAAIINGSYVGAHEKYGRNKPE